MSNRFIISDPHFGTESIRFIPVRKDVCGNMTMVEHDNFLVDNWNGAVGKRDTVYLLGDLGRDTKGYVRAAIVPRLLGNIIVIGGNHDTAEILAAFTHKVNGVITMSIQGYRCVLTHIPIHPQEMFWDYNIHGHIHGNTVKDGALNKEMGKQTNRPDDKRYINVCCEHMNYTPQPLDEVVLARSGRSEALKRKNR